LPREQPGDERGNEERMKKAKKAVAKVDMEDLAEKLGQLLRKYP
jgi:hypothetical protein